MGNLKISEINEELLLKKLDFVACKTIYANAIDDKTYDGLVETSNEIREILLERGDYVLNKKLNTLMGYLSHNKQIHSEAEKVYNEYMELKAIVDKCKL